MAESTRHLDQELSTYLDGELDAAARQRVEAHLRACPDCADALDVVRGVVSTARRLEDRAPDVDLWPGIARRLDAEPATILWLAPPRPVSWRFSFSLLQLAAAAAFVAILSGGLVWWAQRTPMRAAGGSMAWTATSGADASDAAYQTRQYDQAVADLERVLQENRRRLDPVTVQTVESNLAMIDAAIVQARSALLADPANPYLSGHLADQMKRKIRVLQRTADAVTADYSGGAS